MHDEEPRTDSKSPAIVRWNFSGRTGSAPKWTSPIPGLGAILAHLSIAGLRAAYGSDVIYTSMLFLSGWN